MHTLAYASPYVYSDLAYIMLWVAGGNCINNNHYNRYRGTRCDLTLPYLTLPYLTLPCLALPYLKLSIHLPEIYYITIHEANSDRQSAPKTHETLIFLAKQALTRRIFWHAEALLGFKIAPCAHPLVLTRL